MLNKRQPHSEPSENLVERLAQTLGAEATATHIFAPPIERDGVTVIPVAKARYAFGGGSGTDSKQTGFGGGGGAVITPAGYIEITKDGARYRPIRDLGKLLPIIAAGSLLSLLAVRSLLKLLRQ